jgi:hypothetical protein
MSGQIGINPVILEIKGKKVVLYSTFDIMYRYRNLQSRYLVKAADILWIQDVEISVSYM